MFSFTLRKFAVFTLFSTICSVNGAVFQRDGTFTYLSSQPTTSDTHRSSTFPTNSTSSGTTPTISSNATQTTIYTTASTSPTTSNQTSIYPTTTATNTSNTLVTTLSSVTQSTTSSTPVKPTTSAPVTSVPVTSSTIYPPSTTPTASPTGGAGTVSCDAAQQWQAAFAYVAGSQAIFNNQLYTAKQWTFNSAPPTHTDEWTLKGSCSQPIHNKADCSGSSAWQRTTAYTGGSKVTFNGHLWLAVQWSEFNTPGDASGSWQDLGECA